MAQTLIDSLAEKWDPAEYHDSYREHVQSLIEKKQAGHESIAHTEPERGAKVIDLLEALQSSVKKAGGARQATAKKRAPTKKQATTKKRAPAKSSSAKKASTSTSSKGTKRKKPTAPRRKAS
jgi:DNA end-binding protein Ku